MPLFGSDPVKFLRHNLLRLAPSLDNPDQRLLFSDGTLRVKLVDATQNELVSFRHRKRKGLSSLVSKSNQKWWTKPAKVFMVCPAQYTDDDAYAAYVCPYVGNQTHFKMLGSDADVMFTGDMDGCTFGVGMPNRNGDVRVGHANRGNLATMNEQGVLDTTVQRQAQFNSLNQGGTTNMLVNPDNYRQSVTRTGEGWTDTLWCKAITIGLRIKGKWEFYYQHQVHDGGAQWREGLELVKLQ